MNDQLIVVVRKSLASKAQEHALEPKAAFELYHEIRAQRKRRWPEVSFGAWIDAQTGERKEVQVLEAQASETLPSTFAVVTDKAVFVQPEGEELSVFAGQNGQPLSADAAKPKKKSGKKAKASAKKDKKAKKKKKK